MKELIYKTIEILKEKVKANLLEIQNNQKEIRNLLKQPVSVERSEKLEEKYAFNKVLLAENNDFINVQLTLSNFVEKYSNTDIFEQVVAATASGIASESDFFEMTIKGVLNYDLKHPYFNDDNFFNKLLEYYKSLEDYEKCHTLVKARHKKSGLIG